MSPNKTDPDGETRVAPREAAAILGVSTRTVSRMADRGTLHAIPLPSGHRRYMLAEVKRVAKREAAQ